MNCLSGNCKQANESKLDRAGFFSSLVASYVAKLRGRKLCMVLSGICYLIGAGLTTGAVPKQSGLGMLILGRIMLGVGVGFANAVSTSVIETPSCSWKWLQRTLARLESNYLRSSVKEARGRSSANDRRAFVKPQDKPCCN